MTTEVGEAGWADPGEAGDAAGNPVVHAVAPAGEADEAASRGMACTSGPCTSIAPADAGAATGSWEEIRAASAENKSGDKYDRSYFRTWTSETGSLDGKVRACSIEAMSTETPGLE